MKYNVLSKKGIHPGVLAVSLTMNNLGLVNKVKLHLTYSVMWSNITSHSVPLEHMLDQTSKTTGRLNNISLASHNETYVLKGTEPKHHREEYVLAISKRASVTLQKFDVLFAAIENTFGLPANSLEKILVAIVDTDGSILFYNIHRGVKNYKEA